MLGLIVGAVATGGLLNLFKNARQKAYFETACKNLINENYVLRCVNHNLTLTINNHTRLLADYDKVNKYAQREGFRGAVSFFYFLNEHDSRFIIWAKFLNKVKYIRNDVAHNGAIYNIDEAFLKKLRECVLICRLYEGITSGAIEF